MSLDMLVLILLVGAVGGYLGGVVGAGIGATVVPGLVLLSVSPTVAIGSSLLLHIVIAPLGGISHYKFGHVRWKIFVPLVLTGVLGAFLGANISTRLPTDELKILIGFSTIAAGLAITIRFPKWKKRTTLQEALIQLKRAVGVVNLRSVALIGLVAGLSRGALGTGWGPIGVPLLILAGALPQMAIGSSLLARLFVALVGGSTYLALIGIRLDVVLPLLVGGSIAILFGTLTAKRLRPEILKRIVGGAAIVLGASVLIRQVIR